MMYKAFLVFAIAAILLSSSSSGIISGIISFFDSLFHSSTTLAFSSYPSHLTVYFNNPSQFIIGLNGRTVINSTNTTVPMDNGRYSFDIGSVSVANNVAHTKLYIYNLSIINTTAIISVKSNDSVQYLNIGNGTFSIGMSGQLVNQS
ncbi:MAG: hypothetical protein M1360_04455 [Candidatus Marsarchaeota archaeon]|jgi:hypothetical protein|nr:hypothetical protein [Candidatus Marsarchaeota archaeon]MCL5419158.1 hypothetical protein [Candidatus Marsarchaeota archaeon]